VEIAIVTYPKLPDLNPDDHPLRDALRARGAVVRAVSWDATAVDWARFDAVVLRSRGGEPRALPCARALALCPGGWVERSERFLVMELEVFEPQLFFEFSPAAAWRLADGIIERT
jgi:hypothetical protein